jgi:hypothetical protein
MYTGLGMKLPADKLAKHSPLEVGLEGWKLVYMYYWSSFCLLVACLIIFLFLIRRHKADLFDFTSIISRSVVLCVGAAMLALMADDKRLYAAIQSPALLPICVVLLFLVMVTDKLSVLYCNSQLKKSGRPFASEYEGHGHGHERAHSSPESIHETGALRGHTPHGSLSDLESIRKASRWSMRPEDTIPLTAVSTEYTSPHRGYAMEPLTRPGTPDAASQRDSPLGYAPVSTGQNYGT